MPKHLEFMVYDGAGHLHEIFLTDYKRITMPYPCFSAVWVLLDSGPLVSLGTFEPHCSCPCSCH